ncbi:ArnT family glycosyltransferase [Nocardioides marmoraquaticus]
MTATLPAPITRHDPQTPVVRPTRRQRLRGALGRHRRSLLHVVPLLVLTAIVSRVGMFGSPQRIDDEGTYTAQAYAVERFGELAHYTYWYDHPPLGWIQIAGWTWLTDAFDRYDVAVMAGREAMVVHHVVAAGLLWLLARRLDLGRAAATVAVLVFALSPLSVQFSRTVYLDNVALPWLLAAFVLALSRRKQLLAFAGAAACFGVAVLSKETFLLALPFLAWVVWRSADRETRRYTLSVAASLLTLVLASYALFALVKGEVLPGDDRVSLWEGVTFQLLTRAESGSVLDTTTQSGQAVAVWFTLDPVLPVLAGLAALGTLFSRRLRPFAVAFLALSAVVLKPGYLPVMYVIVLIPFAALLVAAVLDLALRRGGRATTALGVAAALVAGAVAVPLWAVQLRGLFLADLDRPMREAQSWVTDNVRPSERILVDDAVWVDLVRDGLPRQNVVWYYKADTDSDVVSLAPNGWQDYDYVLVTQALRRSAGSAPTVDQALENATRTAVFGSGESSVEVFRVDPRGADELAAATDRDQRARAAAGTELVGNPALDLTDDVADLLRTGQVDSRVLSLLAAAAGQRSLSVVDLPVVFGEDGQLPRRSVVLDDVADPEVLAGRIEAQRGSFAASSVTVEGDQVRVEYPVALPTDLLPAPPS